MRSTTTVAALAALSIGQVLAGPTHAHLHRDAHQKKALAKKDGADYSKVDWSKINWSNINVDWNAINYNGAASSSAAASSAATPAPSAPAANPSPSPASVPAIQAAASPSPSASSSAGGSSSSSSSAPPASSGSTSTGATQYTGLFENLWHGLEGCSNTRTAFGSQSASHGSYVDYVSNVGIPYGSNMMLVDAVGSHTYSMTFVNTASDEMTVNCWNKPGMDGQPNSGSTDAPKRTTLTFNLSVGQSAIVAVDENTVLACCEATDHITQGGAFGQTWIEAKFKKDGSGFDVSKILNMGPDYKVTMSALSNQTPCVSSETQNNWITEQQTTGSGSCYVPSGPVNLTIKMSGHT